MCPTTSVPLGSCSPVGSRTTCIVLAVTWSPTFALAELMVCVKRTGRVVWPGRVAASPAGAAMQARSARVEKPWLLMEGFEHRCTLHKADVSLTFAIISGKDWRGLVEF